MAHQIEDVEMSEEEEYDENADEDFNPEATREGEDASSSSEDEDDAATAAASTAAKRTPKSKKRKTPADTVDAELDSGDEATIQEQRKKKRKKDAAQRDVEAGDSGGEGGFVRTRAQRLAETIERKQRKRVTVGEVTIDVQKMWEELCGLPVGRATLASSGVGTEEVDGGEEQNKENQPQQREGDEEMITIVRRIEYAGEVTEVQEQVPKSSKEAQRYLAEHPGADPSYRPPDKSGIQRPLKRPSMFEPNPTANIKGVPRDRLRPRAPSRLDVLMAEKRAEEEARKKAEKMTTVQKSALDWRGFVDQQGLREELDEYGKSKRGFLAREEFLDRAQMARDFAAREARLKA
ncbi:bucentaur or craniofacial development-domain-containing protein [Neohortaea acidophila]|uniref:SWR1-complex protein 5 n=1 Tax=Neohortaea acidophila TaxID=245834 RepID=A0A6A6Q2H4_9PEZI|nr:bucentaur or craniofacial development-domain-containing protein [Neohortaea acidophila]KAF2485617.1 bucentaur or craniofacial development-domain-containing protein [Neohortaea acidophila]